MNTYLLLQWHTEQPQSTGFSPNFMMYGRELSMPVDVMLSLPPGEQYTAGQYGQKLQKHLQFAYEIAWVVLKRTADKHTQLYNQSTFGESMKAGVEYGMLTNCAQNESCPSFNPNGRVLVLSQKCITRSSLKSSYPPERISQFIQTC